MLGPPNRWIPCILINENNRITVLWNKWVKDAIAMKVAQTNKGRETLKIKAGAEEFWGKNLLTKDSAGYRRRMKFYLQSLVPMALDETGLAQDLESLTIMPALLLMQQNVLRDYAITAFSRALKTNSTHNWFHGEEHREYGQKLIFQVLISPVVLIVASIYTQTNTHLGKGAGSGPKHPVPRVLWPY
jgi:hypothetical protein